MTSLIHIFRTGTHTAMTGATLSFSESDLTATAAAYSPDVHEAPIVVGHPKTDGPAYGWIKAVTTEGGQLFAEPHEVHPEFAEMVRNKSFKKVSAAFFHPAAPNNPKPGTYYLRHVGFLGATPPSIKGLRDATFAEGDDGIVEIEFADLDPNAAAGLFRSIRDWIIGRFGQDEADKVIPPDAMNYLQAQASAPDPDCLDPAYSQTQETTELNLTAEQLAQRETDLKAREANLNRQLAEQRRVGNVAFVEGLIAEGRFLPALKAQVLAFMDSIPAETSVTVEFADGTGASVKVSPLDCFKDVMAKAAKVVTFGEVASGGGTGNGGVEMISFAAPAGMTVDKDGLVIHQKALAFQRTNKDVSYLDAVAAVSGSN